MSTVFADRPNGECIRVSGLVQGVGFRPTVWHLAKGLGLTGEILNDSEGVLIRIWGKAEHRERFLSSLLESLPPLARIDKLERSDWVVGNSPDTFRIVASERGAIHTGVLPDAASCDDCVRETLDPFNRRYRYPFTNCTHCGPRFSILRTIPYDRANTSMAEFPLCEDCRSEYENPEDRRFHAQPTACHVCGPKARLRRRDGSPFSLDRFTSLDDIDAAANLLRSGEIVLIKGIGGFHLACDAGNANAVTLLRERKGRPHKPLALMARDIEVIARYAEVGELDRRALLSKEAPIVLLKKQEPSSLPDSIAPGMRRLGFMLPYTPLHHLLLRRWERPIVLTSGNLTDTPQITDEVEAVEALASVTDWILSHDRMIANRVDDSVAVVAAGELRLLRRARGYAPAPVPLPEGFHGLPQILALGSELKNTFCLIKDDQAILSQHMGDLADAQVWEEYQSQLAHYRNLFAHEPERIAIDMHPRYHASQLGQRISDEMGLVLDKIQHHHAHAAAVMGERAVPMDHPPMLTVALDGLGYGPNGALWGGELLLANYRHSQRLGRLLPCALLGGEQAMREPWRNTLAQIFLSIGLKNFIGEYSGVAIADWLKKQPLAVYEHMWRQGAVAPSCSSMGRLFDAVSAACSIAPKRLSFEGQAAMLLEAAITPGMIKEIDEDAYLLPVVTDGELLSLDPRPLWEPLLNDLRQDLDLPEISARFHVGLARSLCSWIAEAFQRVHPASRKIVLCGGVFQNVTLLELMQTQLQESGFEVLAAAQLPSNDGGLSFGQALVSAAHALSDKRAQTERRTPSCA